MMGGLPIRTQLIEGQWVITERIPTPEVLKEDIPVGSIVESIEGMPPGEYCEQNFHPLISAGRRQTKESHIFDLALYIKDTKVKLAHLRTVGASSGDTRECCVHTLLWLILGQRLWERRSSRC